MESLPARVEVAIVGGGLAGLATAWAIGERAGRDAQVAILERDVTVASHASGRNAAMCRALAEDDAWTAVTAAGAAFLRRPPAGFAEVPLVDDRGAVLLAEGAVAEELVARAARFGLRCERVGAAEVVRRWPGLALARGGVWFPDDGNIALGALIEAYAGGARARGACIATGAGVLGIEAAARGGDVAVVTARGVVRAAQVVIAAGPWADEVAGRAAAPALGLVSRRRHVIALDAGAVKAADAPIVWNVDGDEWYVRPAGAELWASGCDGDVVPAGEIAVRDGAVDEARARLPAPLDAAAVVRAWAWPRPVAGGGPGVARDRERPWLVRVVGLGGHGVTASAAIGRAAAAVVLDP
jgi:D-arginine dehydrogenase